MIADLPIQYINPTQYVFSIINEDVEYKNPNQYLLDVLKIREFKGLVVSVDEEAKEQIEQEEQKIYISAPYMPDDWEIDIISKMVYAEANTLSDNGKRAVVDTVINRVRREDKYPFTYSEVIQYPNAFSTWTEGKVQSAPVTQYIRQLVIEELNYQTYPENILYFSDSNYNPYGIPLFNIDNMYFSGG